MGFCLSKSTEVITDMDAKHVGNGMKKPVETADEKVIDNKGLFNRAVTVMNVLNRIQNFFDGEALSLFSALEQIRLTMYQLNERTINIQNVCGMLIKKGLCNIFVRVWDEYHQNAAELYKDAEGIKFKTLHKLKCVFANYLDDCPELAKACYNDARIIERIMKELAIPELSVSPLDQPVFIKSLEINLSILNNVVRLYDRNREHVRKNNGIENILKFGKSTNRVFKANAFILLAYCVNEDENSIIMAETGVVAFIAEQLQSAVESPDHVSTGLYSAKEIIMALNKLASNDDNKKTIVLAGVLPLLTKLLRADTSSPSEQLETVNCIWSLAFCSENKDKIIQEPNLITGVEELRKKRTMDENLKKAIDGLFFVLNLEQPIEKISETQSTVQKHIMLSYSWEVQNIVLQLRDYLGQEGYKTWIDVEKMQDSILGAMADAVENASIVLMAMSEGYKNSNACRTEAEYAYKRKVPVLPLLLQPKYDADGWLGAMVGTKLYVDISSETRQSKFIQVKQQIDALTKTSGTQKVSVTKTENLPVAKQAPPQKSPSDTGLVNTTAAHGEGIDLLRANIPCREWSTQNVQKWYQDIGIKGNKAFENYDGKRLSQLCKLLLRSPDTYYSVLSQNLGLSDDDMLLFTDALESLLPA